MKDHKQNSQEWHRNVKRYCRFEDNKGLLNLKNGPIANID